MFRLAIVSIASGMCIANPIYTTKDQCKIELDLLSNSEEPLHKLKPDETGREYIVPSNTPFAFIIEPVIDEEM